MCQYYSCKCMDVYLNTCVYTYICIYMYVYVYIFETNIIVYLLASVPLCSPQCVTPRAISYSEFSSLLMYITECTSLHIYTPLYLSTCI